MNLNRLSIYIAISTILHFYFLTIVNYSKTPNTLILTHETTILNIKIINKSTQNSYNESDFTDEFKKLKNIAITEVQKINSVPPIKISKTTHDAETLYFTFTKVDVPAMPVGEWVINTEIWPLGDVSTLTFTVWISNTGEIVRWETSNNALNSNLANEALQDIKRTVLNPALRNGTKVPSVRTIELQIDRTLTTSSP